MDYKELLAKFREHLKGKTKEELEDLVYDLLRACDPAEVRELAEDIGLTEE